MLPASHLSFPGVKILDHPAHYHTERLVREAHMPDIVEPRALGASVFQQQIVVLDGEHSIVDSIDQQQRCARDIEYSLCQK